MPALAFLLNDYELSSEHMMKSARYWAYQPEQLAQGGIHGLREKLDKPELKGHFFTFPKIALTTVFAITLLIAGVFTPRLLKPRTNLFLELVKKTENPAFIKYGYLERNGESVSIPAGAKPHLAAIKVKTSDKKVKFYILENTD